MEDRPAHTGEEPSRVPRPAPRGVPGALPLSSAPPRSTPAAEPPRDFDEETALPAEAEQRTASPEPRGRLEAVSGLPTSVRILLLGALLVALAVVLLPRLTAGPGATEPRSDIAVTSSAAATFLREQFGGAPWSGRVTGVTLEGGTIVVQTNLGGREGLGDARAICQALTDGQVKPDSVRIRASGGQTLVERYTRNSSCRDRV